MARVTVEDCVTIVPNRFELVLLTAQRARDISAGMPLTVERDNDKNPVISLREVAEQTIDFEELRRHICRGVNRHAELSTEDDNLKALSEEELPAIESMTGDAGEIKEIEFESDEAPAEEESETLEVTAEELESMNV